MLIVNGDECLTISDLNDLTAIYRYTTPNTAINVGYDAQAAAKFVTDLIDKYPVIQSDKWFLSHNNEWIKKTLKLISMLFLVTIACHVIWRQTTHD